MRTRVLFLCLAAGLLSAGALAVTSVPASVGSGQIAKPQWSHGRIGTKCFLRGGQVRAKVAVLMSAKNTSTWQDQAIITRFKLKAKLRPTTSGLDYQHQWREQRWYAITNFASPGSYSHVLAVVTDGASPNADWSVRVRIIFERRAPVRDIVVERVIPLTGCPGAETGGGGESLG